MSDSCAPGRTIVNLSDIEVAYILGRQMQGLLRPIYLPSAVALDLQSSMSLINTTLKLSLESPLHLEGPKKVSEHDKRNLIHLARKNHHKTLKDITNILPEKVSTRTLQRRLSDVGIQKHIAIKSPSSMMITSVSD